VVVGSILLQVANIAVAHEWSVFYRGERCFLFLSAMTQFGLNPSHLLGCLLMTLLRREPVKLERLPQIL